MKWTRKRADMPVRLGPRSRVNADDPGLDGTALKELKGGFYSATARKSTAARLEWWSKRAARRGREPFPIDLEALTLAGALLKAGRYRSAQQYLYTIKKEHMARGHVWDVALDSAFKDIRRSCERGLGGPKQAGALSLDEMRNRGTYEGVVLAEASLAIVFGSWWLLREIELAAMTVGQVSFEKGAGCGVAVVKIAASKADTRAAGTTRRHGCACPSPLCPVAVARKLVGSRKGAAGGDPLITNKGGEVVTKEEMVTELRGFAAWLGDADVHITGHSMRVTGAQRLALAGVSEGKIRLFGRWASRAMFKYTREALLGKQGLLVAKQVEAAGEPQPAAASSTCTLTAAAKRKWGLSLRPARA